MAGFTGRLGVGAVEGELGLPVSIEVEQMLLELVGQMARETGRLPELLFVRVVVAGRAILGHPARIALGEGL